MKHFYQGFWKQARLKSNVTLQEQQKRVQKTLPESKGLLVYHGLGSGKTLSSLAATQGTSTDVVVPASLRENYRKEVKKYTEGHKPNIQSFEGYAKAPPKPKESLVIDEGHFLGNVGSKRTQAIMKQAPEYKQRMVLTGTPIRNSPEEIAPLMNIVRGGTFFPADPQAFAKQFIAEERVNPGIFNRIFRGAKPGVRYSIKNPNQFEQLVKGYVDYHAPSQENFPSTSHEVVETPMNDEQLKYYKFVMGKASPALRWKIKMGLPPSKSEAKSLNSFLTGARQVANSTKAFGGTKDSPKIMRAVDELKRRDKKDKNFKAVVYSNFLDSGVQAYADQLEREKIPYAVFDGSLSDKKRKEVVDAYNSGKIKALLISGAGAQGLDLKGTKLVQLLEPHWNNPRLEQATGRAIRYGSHEHLPIEDRHVHVQRFMSTVPKTFLQKITRGKQDTSVDQYLDMLSSEKERLNNQFLDILKKVGTHETET